MPRLLVLSVGAGAGHNRAAEAIQAACSAYFPGVESRWVDSLRFTSKVFRTFYAESYLFLAGRSPSLWGMLYKSMGKNVEHRRLRKIVQMYDRLAYRRLVRTIDAFRPDAVVCTHFLPADVLITRRKGLPVYVVVTDFDVHSLWVNRKAKGYFVGSEEVAWQLARFGYPASGIRVTGIPVHPSFATGKRDGSARRRVGLPEGRPVVLFMSGGFGMGDMIRAVERILETPQDFHLVVICGKNEAVRRKVAALAGEARGRMTALGYVTNMPDYLEASDLAVTKAGGLSVSECLARGLPMVIFAPIPGQEGHNSDYLLELGAAVKAKSLEVVDYKIRELLADPDRLRKMKGAALAAARPEAAREVVSHLLRDLA